MQFNQKIVLKQHYLALRSVFINLNYDINKELYKITYKF